MRTLLCAAVSAIAVTASLAAQKPEDQRFEAVSIKPNRSPEPGGRNALEPGRYVDTGVTLRRLIALAYGPLPLSLIDGGPPWLNSDRFDVQAKFEGNPPRDQLQRMMQNLLADRFKLRTHLETRPTSAFALTVERAGVLGPSLRPAELDCASRPQANVTAVPTCAIQVREGLIRGRVTLDQVATLLTAERVIVNRTELVGHYDVELRWTSGPGAPANADAPPGLATAIREQLGLRLQPVTVPLDHLVIDSAERPDPD